MSKQQQQEQQHLVQTFLQEHVHALYALFRVPCPEPFALQQNVQQQQQPVFIEAELFCYEQMRQAQQQALSLLACLTHLQFGVKREQHEAIQELRHALQIHQRLRYHYLRAAYKNV